MLQLDESISYLHLPKIIWFSPAQKSSIESLTLVWWELKLPVDFIQTFGPLSKLLRS